MEESLEFNLEKAKAWLLQEYDRSDKVVCSALFEKKPQDEPALEALSSDIVEAEILLMTVSTKQEEIDLLKRMASAISSHIAKAHCLVVNESDKENFFHRLFHSKLKARWILISEMELYLVPELMNYYKRGAVRTLGEIPIFFLADLGAYNKDTELKKCLWSTLLGQL